MLTKITHDHLDLFLDLKKNNPGQWKLGEEFDRQIDNVAFFKERMCHERAYTLGWIKNDRLLSITSLFEFNTNASWAWLYYGNIKENYTNFSKTHGLEIIQEMFLEASRRKLSSCVMLVRDNFPSITSDAVGSMKKKIESWHDQVPEIKKYHWVDECKIPADSEAKYEYIKWLMGYKTYPINLRVRLGIIKQEYRQEIL